MTPGRIATRAGQALLHATIVALGTAAIVGSGGGGAVGFPDTSCLSTPQGCSPPPAAQPTASLTPPRPVVQVGMPLQFSVTADVVSPTYRWCWKPQGAVSCSEISGATGPTYAWPAATLADDGGTLQVTVSGSNGEAVAGAVVAVSSMPAVTITDAEFEDGHWTLAALAVPPLPGLAFSATRIASDGHPGAYRLLVLDLPMEERSVSLFGVSTAAVYSPATQGAIYLIEFGLDCGNIAVALDASFSNYWLPTIEQGERRFMPDRNAGASCFSPGWYTRSWLALGAAAFKLVDGPPCGAGEACPDFSSQGPAMRLGLAYNVQLRSPLPAPGAASAPHFEQGLDNFKATVWRR